jgi:hypothetical protein
VYVVAAVDGERELTVPVRLCLADGRLNPAARGWSRQPLHHCALPGSWGRRKRWDYWCVTTPTHVLSVTVADVDYLALADVWCLELGTRRVFRKAWGAPLGAGVELPDQVGGASIDVRRRGFRVGLLEDEAATRIVVDAGSRFACDITLRRPYDHESLSVVIPWSGRRFQCTTKDNTRPATGTISWDGEQVALPAGASWGCLDYGRGKWPYRTAWNWGSASGSIGEQTVGLQLGGKWTVGTGFTENALCVDGRLTKLSHELDWVYDRSDWLRPWRITSPGRERVDLTFTPVYDKPSRLELGVASSTVHQCFGTYAGTVVPDRRDPIAIDGLFGWAEEARWRW